MKAASTELKSAFKEIDVDNIEVRERESGHAVCSTREDSNRANAALIFRAVALVFSNSSRCEGAPAQED